MRAPRLPFVPFSGGGARIPFLKTDDEPACLRYLIQKRWPRGVHCAHCRRAMNFTTKRSLFQCPRCSKQVSATAGTIFHKSRLPLKVWFQAMHFILTPPDGISALELQKRLRLKSYRAAWLLLHKIRSVMLPREEAIVWKDAMEHRHFVGRGSKRSGASHGWSSKYHRAYAAESAYRAGLERSVSEPFGQLLADCIATPGVTLRDITA